MISTSGVTIRVGTTSTGGRYVADPGLQPFIPHDHLAENGSLLLSAEQTYEDH